MSLDLIENYILDPNLVLYVPLHKKDGAKFMSDDAYGHLATRTGALWRPNGHYFDGTDDRITIPHNAIFNFERTDSFSIFAWIKLTNPAASDVIVAKQNTTPYNGYGFDLTTGLYIRLTLSNRAVAPLNYIQVRGNTKVDDSNWHFVGSTYNGSSAASGVSLYVDSRLETPTIAADSLTATTVTTVALRVGTYEDLVSYLDGTCGEVLIYNRALTSAEIQRIYTATKWRYR